ncbi:hypothetical protein BFC16_19540, partial [Pseudoalteromonas sp. JW3]|uniref:non-ribosomal peptide synthetase n=1 Tax=Pseudoalteromonas sp. JW3 TaxID=1859458 RepID=UPI0008DA005A
MTLLQIILECKNRGIELEVYESQLKLVAHNTDLPEYLIAAIKQKKHELIEWLTSDNQLTDLVVTDEPKVLSAAQKGLWLANKLSNSSNLFNIPFALKLMGELNIAVLEASFQKLLAHHEVLRTTIFEMEGELELRELDPNSFAIEHQTRDELGALDMNSELKRLSAVKFDLSADFPIKVTLVELQPNEYLLVIVLHHIATDGWSNSIIVKDLCRFYKSLSQGGQVEQSCNLDYSDFAKAQHNWLNGLAADVALEYWHQYLADIPACHALNLDHSRTENGYLGAHINTAISGKLASQLKAFCYQQNVTLFTALKVVLGLALSRWTQCNDVVLGFPIACRDSKDLADIVGMIMNTQVCRIKVDEEASFSQLIMKTQNEEYEASLFNRYPFEFLADNLSVERLTHVSPIYQVMISMHNYEKAQVNLSDLTVEVLDRQFDSAKLDLILNITEANNELELEWQFNAAILSTNTIDQFAKAFNEFLSALLRQPALPLHLVETLGIESKLELSKHRALGTVRRTTNNVLIKNVFSSVLSTSQAIALTDGTTTYSYHKLGSRIYQIASKLRENGVSKGDIISVCLPRTCDLPALLLAIQAIGAVYVPIDPESPANRQKAVVAQSNSKFFVYEQGLQVSTDLPVTLLSLLQLTAANLSEFVEISELQAFLYAIDVQETDPVYIMFTSGSTGQPKGVVITHKGLMNYLHHAQESYLGDVEGSVVSSSIAFDATITTLYSPLLVSKSVTLLPQERDLSELQDILHNASSAKLFKLTPAHLDSIALNCEHIDLEHVFVIGGSQLLAAQLAKWVKVFPKATFINEYGPTETVVGCTNWNSKQQQVPQGYAVPIGTALPNYQLYVVDQQNRLVPDGAVGELLIGGDSVSPEYFGQGSLSAEKFINVNGLGKHLYKTGDLVRWNESKQLIFIGRADEQIDLNGYRIEPGEVEQLLLQAKIASQVAVFKADLKEAGKLLVAALVSEHSEEEISAYMQAHLPEYMIPKRLLLLDDLPLTVNGKVNQAEIVAQLFIQSQTKTTDVTDRERALLEVWCQVIGNESISVEDKFFAVSGDSIKALLIVAQAKKAGFDISLSDLYQKGSVRAIVDSLDEPLLDCAGNVQRTGTTPLSPIQSWFLNSDIPKKARFFQSFCIKVSDSVSLSMAEAAVKYWLTQYDSFRYQYLWSEEQVRANILPVDEALTEKALSVHTLSANDNVESELQRLAELTEQSINLNTGELFKSVWLSHPEKGNYFFICVHHLAIDAISWTIMLADLELFAKSGNPYENSRNLEKNYSDYALFWHDWAKSEQSSAHQARWQSLLTKPTRTLVESNENSLSREQHIELFEIQLSQGETDVLKTGLTKLLNKRADVVLLGALQHAICAWKGRGATLVELEGHGRLNAANGQDFSHTVGWFTSIYPVVLPAFESEDCLAQIRGIDLAINHVSQIADSYLCLKAHADNDSLLANAKSDVLFNYIGEVGLQVEQSEHFDFVDIAREENGNFATHPISVNIAIRADKLVCQVRVQTNLIDADEALKFVDTLSDSLALYCRWGKEVIRTPSNRVCYQMARASENELSNWHTEGVKEIYPATGMQQGLLFHGLLESGKYVTQTKFTFSKLDFKKFASAWQGVVQRYDILRTGFDGFDEGNIHQIVYDNVELPFEVVDLSQHSEAQQDAAIEAFSKQDKHTSFNLVKPPLMRITCFDLGAKQVVFWSYHHVLLDGWCRSLLFTDLIKIYNSEPLLNEVVQYQDYVVWLEQQDMQRLETYWQNELALMAGQTPLPQVFKTDNANAQGFSDYSFSLTDLEIEKLTTFAKQSEVSLNTVLRGAWSILLARYADVDIVRFGAISSGRPVEMPNSDAIVGLFINCLPVTVDLKQQIQIKAWLQSINNNVALQENNNFLPLSDIKKLYDNKELFESILVYENFPVDESLFASDFGEHLSIDDVHSIEGTNYPITVIANHADSLSLRVETLNSVYAPQAAQQFATHLKQILLQLCESNNISDVNMLCETQRQAVLANQSITELVCEQDTLIHELIETSLARRPDDIAVFDDICALSNRDLNTRANQLAAYLREEGVKPNDLVAVCLPATAQAIVAILAVLKAGAAYVPIDQDYPASRHKVMMEVAKPNYLLNLSECLIKPESAKQIILDDVEVQSKIECQPIDNLPRAKGQDVDNILYLIFTSGSTGRPKGAIVSHRNEVNLLDWYVTKYGFNQASRALIVSSLGFDLTQKNLLAPLVSGGAVCLIGNKYFAADDARDKIKQWHISHVNCAPSTMYHITDNGDTWPEVSWILLGGEPINTTWLNKWVSEGESRPNLVNMYGPSECTDISCDFILTPQYWLENQVTPIGRAMDNVNLYILDSELRLAPQGAIGELFVGGESVGLGYYGQPELTAERFITVSLYEGHEERVYRTGDLVRQLPDNNIEFIGRKDDQVKIRGFRIELGEIEYQLSQSSDVQSCVVVAREDEPNKKQLVAYVVLSNKEAISAEVVSSLKLRLTEQLPDYMVPSAILVLDEMPLTANGKVNKKQLPMPDWASIAVSNYVAPMNDIEQQLVVIWAELLGLAAEQLSIDANFFELGGDSILSIQVVSKAAKAGLFFSVKALFDMPTIRRLATSVNTGPKVLAPQEATSGAQPLLPIHREFFTDETDINHFNQSLLLQVPDTLTLELLQAMFTELYQRHDALRLVFTKSRDEQWQGQYVAHSAQSISSLVSQITWPLTSAQAQIGEFADYATQVHKSLDITAGRLMKAVLVKNLEPTKQDQHVFICVHHLVIDGVSWRVLLDDLTTLFEQHQAGNALKLGAKSSSYQQWGEFLEDYAQRSSVVDELGYWQAVVSSPVARWSASAPEHGLATTYEEANFSLSTALTSQLINESNQAYRTRINELLLAGLFVGMKQWQGVSGIRLDLESHGREALSDEIDLSETLGWFTSIYPCLLSHDSDDVAALICAVKEQYRGIPNGGIGYGLLRHGVGSVEGHAVLSEGDAGSELLFNYLGQFDASTGERQKFSRADISTGQGVSVRRAQAYGLSLNGFVEKGQLHISLGYDKAAYSQTFIAQWMAAYEAGLAAVIAHCQQVNRGELAGRFTVSDFPLATVTEQALIDWSSLTKGRLLDLYPATGMQQGMLFHSLLSSDSYATQVKVEFTDLHVEHFRQAWEKVIARHDIFRTSFVGVEDGNAHQLVQSDVMLDWQEISLLELTPVAQQAAIEQYRTEDKAKGFIAAHAPLMRLTVFNLSEAAEGTKQVLLWTHHHALLDGWCTSLVFGEVTEYYRALQTGSEAQLGAVEPYKGYVQWLAEQPATAAREYWHHHLRDVEGVTPLPFVGYGVEVSEHEEARNGIHQARFSLEAEKTAALVKLARACQTTVNVIVQAAWSLLLSRYSGESQVMFGVTVSGRPAQLKGVDEMVGLFINTVPMKVTVDESQTLEKWLRQLHKDLVDADSYSYLPLSDIQQLAPTQQQLFDSLFIFENYPVD